ncbi:MAG TPA: signal peptidase I [Gaiellaceae bacterium]|nr:signal peptidase I [Gaiellaceae bacterium]
MSGRAAIRASAAVGVVVAGLGAWHAFAPAQLGGATRYAIVQGSSMEPELSHGDLVLVRPGRDLRVGDIVLYRDPGLGASVLHRVVAEREGRLELKGDANGFIDDARPRPDEVAGTLWLTIPRIGVALLWLREPFHAALLVFALAFASLAGGSAAAGASPREEPSTG